MNKTRAKTEAEAVQFILDTLTAGRPELSASLAAGACMKVSVMLARTLNEEAFPTACRVALENVINDLCPTTQQLN